MATLQEILTAKKGQVEQMTDLLKASLSAPTLNLPKLTLPVIPAPVFAQPVLTPTASTLPIDLPSVEAKAKADFEAMTTKTQQHIDAITKYRDDTTALYQKQQADILAAYQNGADAIRNGYSDLMKGIQDEGN